MKVEVRYKNGQIEITEITKVQLKTKNPCIKCRNDGGCYDHGCFMPEDWGNFIVSGNNELRMQDIDDILIMEF